MGIYWIYEGKITAYDLTEDEVAITSDLQKAGEMLTFTSLVWACRLLISLCR